MAQNYDLQLLTPNANGLTVPMVGVWVQLANNDTGVNYVSTGITNGTGKATFAPKPPGDTYVINTSAVSNSGPWTAFGVSNHAVPVIQGDNPAFQGVTTVVGGPYVPTAAAGGEDFGATVRMGGGPIWDITHPNFGAKGDCRRITDAAITISTAIMSSPAQAQFTQADVGKRVDINGAVAAGTTGNVFTATILSVQSATSCTLNTTASITVSGAAANIGTDNQLAIQAAINKQQTLGGRVKIPRDPYGGQYLTDPGLIPAPGSRAGGFTSATMTLHIEGDGMDNVSIVAGGPNAFSGLLGYQSGIINARVIVTDLTLDGNYLGQGGVLPQPSSGSSALVSLATPFTDPATPQNPNGLYSYHARVRYYRSPCFVFQGMTGQHLTDCLFQQVGQPELASGATHYDNLGSGQSDAIVTGCQWKDSSGNYVDSVDGTGGAGHLLRFIFMGNESFNHQIGGVYACGLGSVISGNRLRNTVAGSGIGYDVGTTASMRSKNIVTGNTLDNMIVNGSGLSAVSYGDQVWGNNSSDTNAVSGGLTVFQGGLASGLAPQAIAYAAAITPDLSKGTYITVGTLTGGMTINNPTNTLAQPGQLLAFNITQDGTGLHTLAYGTAYKGVVQPALGPGAISTIFFMSDTVGNWIPLSPFTTDNSGNIQGASQSQKLLGLVLGQNLTGLLASPDLTTDGTNLYVHVNGATMYFRPTGNNQNNALSGNNSGLWQTYDSSGVARNILDDGSGQSLTKQRRIVKQTPAFAASPAPDPTLGEMFAMAALTGNVTVANPVNAAQGQRLLFIWTQDGTGTRTVTYSGTNWRSVGIAAQSTAASTVTIDEANCIDGTIWRVNRLVTGQTI